MVNEIIDVLNHTLDGFMPGQKVYGLAQTVHYCIQGPVEEYLPALVARDGELTYAGIDDTVPVIIYHKMGGMTTQQQTRGFGDGVGDVVNTFTMALVVYWSRKRLNVYPHEMVPLIQARFPQLIRDVPNIKITRIRMAQR